MLSNSEIGSGGGVRRIAAPYLHYIRLAGFPIGLGLTSVLVSGTLNRVMIAELDLPALLVGLFLAIPLLISPARVWLGYRSDTYPLWGLRREPYIIFGSLVAVLGLTGATIASLNIDSATGLMIGATLLAFTVYGLGKNLSSNTFEALLADKFEGDQRPKAVTFFKIAMFMGIMVGAIALGKLLDPFSVSRLTCIVASVAILAFLLTNLATFRQEPRTALSRDATRKAREASFLAAIKTLVWSDPQVRRFFIMLMLIVVGTQAQDVLLEPYGGLVLDMSVGETTRLTAIWGGGTLLAMIAAGMWLIKRFDYSWVLRIGLFINAIVFAGLIISGFSGMVGLFQMLVFALGIGTGLSAAGMLTAAIEFTTLMRAGLLMGVWGMAHELGQAFGSLIGGGIVDLVRSLTGGNALAAYGTVFAIEGLLLLIAIVFVKKVDVSMSAAMVETVTEGAT